MMISGYNDSTVGITSIGYYIPEDVITSREISRISGIPLEILTDNFGIEQKHVAGCDEHPVSMAENAVRSALENGQVDPVEIDIIAYCGAGYYDYQFWSPSAKLQHSIGARHAFTFDIRTACNGGNIALSICTNLLHADSSRHHALIVCSDRLSTIMDYNLPHNLPFFALGDGAVAAILSRNEPTNTLLAYDGITDGMCGDYVRAPYGGTRGSDDEYSRGGARQILVDPTKALAEVAPEVFLGNFTRVIRNAVARSGYEVSDIDWVLTNQIKKTRVITILESLGLTEENTRRTMREYGSLGPGDTLFALALHRQEGLIRPGDLVVLASSGIGFTWGAQVVRFL